MLPRPVDGLRSSDWSSQGIKASVQLLLDAEGDLRAVVLLDMQGLGDGNLTDEEQVRRLAMAHALSDIVVVFGTRPDESRLEQIMQSSLAARELQLHTLRDRANADPAQPLDYGLETAFVGRRKPNLVFVYRDAKGDSSPCPDEDARFLVEDSEGKTHFDKSRWEKANKKCSDQLRNPAPNQCPTSQSSRFLFAVSGASVQVKNLPDPGNKLDLTRLENFSPSYQEALQYIVYDMLHDASLAWDDLNTLSVRFDSAKSISGLPERHFEDYTNSKIYGNTKDMTMRASQVKTLQHALVNLWLDLSEDDSCRGKSVHHLELEHVLRYFKYGIGDVDASEQTAGAAAGAGAGAAADSGSSICVGLDACLRTYAAHADREQLDIDSRAILGLSAQAACSLLRDLQHTLAAPAAARECMARAKGWLTDAAFVLSLAESAASYTVEAAPAPEPQAAAGAGAGADDDVQHSQSPASPGPSSAGSSPEGECEAASEQATSAHVDALERVFDSGALSWRELLTQVKAAALQEVDEVLASEGCTLDPAVRERVGLSAAGSTGFDPEHCDLDTHLRDWILRTSRTPNETHTALQRDILNVIASRILHESPPEGEQFAPLDDEDAPFSSPSAPSGAGGPHMRIRVPSRAKEERRQLAEFKNSWSCWVISGLVSTGVAAAITAVASPVAVPAAATAVGVGIFFNLFTGVAWLVEDVSGAQQAKGWLAMGKEELRKMVAVIAKALQLQQRRVGGLTST